MDTENTTLTVTQTVDLINQSLYLTLPLVQVEGEVSGYSLSKNRWIFFDVKDENSSIKCFLPKPSTSFVLEDGMKVLMMARPNLHNKYGFSLVVESVMPSGEGSIKRALELTKQKLAKEGLFDQSRKRALPKYPEKIALITSSEAAAYSDVLTILSKRWPVAEIVHAETQVQGDNAVRQIIKAINLINNMTQLPDFLIIARGGGSLEDMMAFNDEQLVRVIALSRVPTVVAVGHERDESLAELTADLRANTPTDAALKSVPDMSIILGQIDSAQKAIVQSYRYQILDFEARLSSGLNVLKSSFSRLDDWLMSTKDKLQALDPSILLRRGYAIVRDENGHVLRDAKQTKVGDIIKTKLHKGEITSQVKNG